MKALRFLALALRWIGIAPLGALGLLAAAFVRLVWGTSSRWHRGIWWVTLSHTSWLLRRIQKSWSETYAATTFGPLAVIIAPASEKNGQIIAHEAHHAEQAEAHALAGFVIAIACAVLGHFALAMLVWIFLHRLVYIGGTVGAFARGADGYKGNVMESSAYAIGREVPK